MINFVYFILLCFFYVINIKADWFELRPDTIYLSYFFVIVLIISCFLDAKLSLGRNTNSYNEELTYYVKMGIFFYLAILDSLRNNYVGLCNVVKFFTSIYTQAVKRYLLYSQNLHRFGQMTKHYYLLEFIEKCALVESTLNRFVKHLFYANVVKLARPLVNSR